MKETSLQSESKTMSGGLARLRLVTISSLCAGLIIGLCTCQANSGSGQKSPAGTAGLGDPNQSNMGGGAPSVVGSNPAGAGTNTGISNGQTIPGSSGAIANAAGGANVCNMNSGADLSQKGPYTAAQQQVGTQTIIYPQGNCKASPVIGWGNGTGTGGISVFNYGIFFNHLASHGFIVVTDSSSMPMTDGSVDKNIAAGLQFADQNCGGSAGRAVGAAGHSQGGFAANASTKANAVAALGAPGRSFKGAPSVAIGTSMEATGGNMNVEIKGVNHISEGILGGTANQYINLAMTAWFRGYLCKDASALKIFDPTNAANVSGWAKVTGTLPPVQ